MAHTVKFRDKFTLVSKNLMQYYPGHMNKSFKVMQKKIRDVDCLVEVHDARIPFSGRNPNFVRNLIGLKPHILVLNKTDLVPRKSRDWLKENISMEGIYNVIFTNCIKSNDSGVSSIVSTAADLISKSDRYNRSVDNKYRLMIIGVPNVGKSSLINALRTKHLGRGHAVAVGALAGVTKSVHNEVKICQNPPMMLVDTPGILDVKVPNVETGMKLALCGCLQDHLVGVTVIADYLLYWLNKHKNFKYVEMFKLDEPADLILPVLVKIAKNLNVYHSYFNVANNTTISVPDVEAAARHMIKAFREGEFGRLVLDDGYSDYMAQINEKGDSKSFTAKECSDVKIKKCVNNVEEKVMNIFNYLCPYTSSCGNITVAPIYQTLSGAYFASATADRYLPILVNQPRQTPENILITLRLFESDHLIYLTLV